MRRALGHWPSRSRWPPGHSEQVLESQPELKSHQLLAGLARWGSGETTSSRGSSLGQRRLRGISVLVWSYQQMWSGKEKLGKGLFSPRSDYKEQMLSTSQEPNRKRQRMDE